MRNPHFNNFTNTAEQTLIENLVVEAIKIYGHDVYYIPRDLGAKDELLNEDDLSTFTKSYMIEMYIKNVESWGGEGDFLSKFGLQIRDQTTLTVSRRSFFDEVAAFTEQLRPKEGDVIYMPMNEKLWEIQHVEHEAIQYQTGALQVYDLACELFEHSNETFNTGITEIDTRYTTYNITSNTAYANIESVDVWADNQTIEKEADAILDFDEENPWGESSY